MTFAAATPDMAGDKIRFRFHKADELRLLSHHDLMRCTERMLRRAELPFKSTAGFHPLPRFVFASSLPLGIIALREVVELELLRPMESEEVRDRLNRVSPIGLVFNEAKIIPMKASAVPLRAIYQLPLPADRVDETMSVATELMSSIQLWADRLHPKPRRVNIRPYIRGIHVMAGFLNLDIWITQNGTAKAEEIIRSLGLYDLLEVGAVLVRTDLDIRDEAVQLNDLPPEGPPESAPLEHAPVGAEDDATTGSGTWGMSPNGPVVE